MNPDLNVTAERGLLWYWVTCPECKAVQRPADYLAIGDEVRCFHCAALLTVIAVEK